MSLKLCLVLWLAATGGWTGLVQAAEPDPAQTNANQHNALQRSLPAPSWDLELALQTAAMGADESRLSDWFRMAREGQSAELLNSIQAFGQAATFSSPVRESALLLFVRGLADFPPALLPEAVLDYLATRPVQTFVLHEESADTAVPLFNIPAAVQGLRNRAEAEKAEFRSVHILAGVTAGSGRERADEWIAAYLAGTEPERVGYLRGLTDLSAVQANQLGAAAQARMTENAALVEVAGRAALIARDREALQLVLTTGRGPELTRLLRESREQLSEPDRVLLLLGALQSAPAENAALAIALLTPDLHDSEDVTASLFDLLEDPALGTSAALALAQYSDPDVQHKLKKIAAGDRPESGRARLAMALEEEMSEEPSLPDTPR